MTDDSVPIDPTTPTVSVYIPTRNRRRQLARALRAVLVQAGAKLDVIVVDDASTDGTPTMLRRLERKGLLRSVLLPEQRGAQAARNAAVALATGDFITGADDDDIWLPGRLKALLTEMDAGAPFVAATDIMDLGNGQRYLQLRPRHLSLDALLRRNVVGNQVMCRTDAFRRCGIFDESLPASQDYDLWIRLALTLGEGRGLVEPLQWVDASSHRKRISTSRKRRRGVWLVYRKYRHLMTPAQRRAHMFNVLRTTDRRLSMRTAMVLASGGDRLRVILHVLRGAIPWIDEIIMAVLVRRHRRVVSEAISSCASPHRQHGDMR